MKKTLKSKEEMPNIEETPNIIETPLGQEFSYPEQSVAPDKKITLSKKKVIVGAIVLVVVLAIGALVYYYRGLVVAASVNGSLISRLTVIKELEKMSGKSTLEMLINQKLIDGEATKKGIVVSSEDIESEINKIKQQITAQGQSFEDVLTAQGITMESLNKQIATQKKMEKLVADKIQVNDEEIQQYLKDSGVKITEEDKASYEQMAKNYLEQQKLNTAANNLINILKSQAKINYFVHY